MNVSRSEGIDSSSPLVWPTSRLSRVVLGDDRSLVYMMFFGVQGGPRIVAVPVGRQISLHASCNGVFGPKLQSL